MAETTTINVKIKAADVSAVGQLIHQQVDAQVAAGADMQEATLSLLLAMGLFIADFSNSIGGNRDVAEQIINEGWENKHHLPHNRGRH